MPLLPTAQHIPTFLFFFLIKSQRKPENWISDASAAPVLWFTCGHLFPCPFPPCASMQNHPAEAWSAAYHIPAVLFWLRTRPASQTETSSSQFSQQNGRGNLIKMAKQRWLLHVCLITSRFTPDSAVHLGGIRSLDYSGLTHAATVCANNSAPSQIPSRSIKCLQVYCSNEVKWQNTKANKLGYKRLKPYQKWQRSRCGLLAVIKTATPTHGAARQTGLQCWDQCAMETRTVSGRFPATSCPAPRETRNITTAASWTNSAKCPMWHRFISRHNWSCSTTGVKFWLFSFVCIKTEWSAILPRAAQVTSGNAPLSFFFRQFSSSWFCNQPSTVSKYNIIYVWCKNQRFTVAAEVHFYSKRANCCRFLVLVFVFLIRPLHTNAKVFDPSVGKLPWQLHRNIVSYW